MGVIEVGSWVWLRRWIHGCGREGGFMGVVKKVDSWVWSILCLHVGEIHFMFACVYLGR